jgi:hypothetical protein
MNGLNVQPESKMGSGILHLREHIDLSVLSYFSSSECTDLAIQVSGYLSESTCQSLLEQARQNERINFEHYAFAPQLQVTRMGTIYGEACADPSRFDEYFGQVPLSEAAIRSSFFPLLSPIDKLRMDLDAGWPGGAVVAKLGGRRMLPGFLRCMLPGGEIRPHQDDLLLETHVPIDFDLTVELVNNIYLEVPPTGCGGELEIYDYCPKLPKNLDESYGERRGEEAPYVEEAILEGLDQRRSVRIAPAVGDLIIFRSSCIHRVHPVTLGNRISSCFHIGVADLTKPLNCWC